MVSKLYTANGDLLDLPDKTYEGNVFFRKQYRSSGDLSEDPVMVASKFYQERLQSAMIEREIAKILKSHPQPNIVTVYDVQDNYIDIELMDSPITDFDKMFQNMEAAKKQMQQLGIMYIDWKLDNIGRAKDGTYKLFDFDVSGIININKPNEWVYEPMKYYNYMKVHKTVNRALTPIEIDDMAFELLRNDVGKIKKITK